jgi:hypothetical protein
LFLYAAEIRAGASVSVTVDRSCIIVVFIILFPLVS